MDAITECKKRVRNLLRDYHYTRTTIDEFNREKSKTYYFYRGEIHVHVDEDLSFHFGVDELMGCSAHICANGTDCCTHFQIAEEIFKKMLTGESSKKDVQDYIASL